MIDTMASSTRLVLGRTLFVLNGRPMRCERMFVDTKPYRPAVSVLVYRKKDGSTRLKEQLWLNNMLMVKSARPSGRTVIYFIDFTPAHEDMWEWAQVLAARRYDVVIKEESDDGEPYYVAGHTDSRLLNCIADGYTPQEAMEKLAKARVDYIFYYLVDNQDWDT